MYIRQNVRCQKTFQGARSKNLQREHDFPMKTIAPAAGFSLRGVVAIKRKKSAALLFATGAKRRYGAVQRYIYIFVMKIHEKIVANLQPADDAIIEVVAYNRVAELYDPKFHWGYATTQLEFEYHSSC